MGSNASTSESSTTSTFTPEVETREIKGKKVTKTTLQPPGTEGKLAFVLDGVFSEEKCKEWIKMTEDKGYEKALVNIGGGKQKLMEDVRNNMRCIIDSHELANELFEIIKEFLPETFKRDRIVSLNERLRFLRYDPGQKFEPHMDGMYVRPDGIEKSHITVQLYLNGGFEGGATTFLNDFESERLEVVPEPGRVLIFEHRLLHEGSALIKGRKYACRTDVMYTSKKSEDDIFKSKDVLIARG